MAKKLPIIKVGLYSMNPAVDSWLREESEEFGIDALSKKDHETDFGGIDAALFLDIQDAKRAEDLYLLAQDAIAQGVHVIWACDGNDAWYRQVENEMKRKKQTVIEFGLTNDPLKLYQGLVQLSEEWKDRSAKLDNDGDSNLVDTGRTQEEDFSSRHGEEQMLEEPVAQEEDRELGDKTVKETLPGITVQDTKPLKVTNDTFSKLKKRISTAATIDRTQQVKEKVVRVGTSIIGVVSAANGSGSTYSAIQMGLFLRKFSKHVAVLELSDERNLKRSSFLSLVETNDPKAEVSFHINGIDFAFAQKPSSLLKNKRYDFVVMDIGPLSFQDYTGSTVINQHIDELERATIGCITATGSPWGYYDLLDFLKKFDSHRTEWKILLQHPSSNQKNDIENDLQEVSENYQVFGIPYQPDPFVLEEETEKVLKHFLREIIPQDEKKNFINRLLNR